MIGINEEIIINKEHKGYLKLSEEMMKEINENKDDFNEIFSENMSILRTFNYNDALSNLAKKDITISEAGKLNFLNPDVSVNDLLESKTKKYYSITSIRESIEDSLRHINDFPINIDAVNYLSKAVCTLK